MEYVMSILSTTSVVIDILGAVILLLGFLKGLMRYISAELKYGFKTPMQDLQSIRCQVGIYILMALDFLIASDIILSMVELSMEQLISLSAAVVLRIAIGYFLGKEIEELNRDEL